MSENACGKATDGSTGSDKSVCDDCGSTFDNNRGLKAHVWQTDCGTPRQYTKESVIRRLYLDEKLSLQKVADRFDVDAKTIDYWRKKHGIKRRSRQEAALHKPPNFYTTKYGYERVQTKYDGDKFSFPIHRLVAVAEYGFEALEGNIVHHKNGVSWDNRPENLEVMSQSEHMNEHNSKDDYQKMGRKGGLARHGLVE